MEVVERCLCEEDEKVLRDIAYRLYYNNFILQKRVNMELSKQTTKAMFKTIKDRNLDRLQSSKYLFLSFSKKSFCDVLLYDEETKLYFVPQYNDPEHINFDLEKFYFLRILSTGGIETIFSVDVYYNSVTKRVLIAITSVRGKLGHAFTYLTTDPITIMNSNEDECCEYLRNLWSQFNIVFFVPAFQRVKNGLSILSSKATSPTSPI